MDSEAVVRTDRARVLWQSAEGEKVPIAKEAQEDLEVAWENLEVARVIYEKHKDQVSGYGPMTRKASSVLACLTPVWCAVACVGAGAEEADG